MKPLSTVFREMDQHFPELKNHFKMDIGEKTMNTAIPTRIQTLIITTITPINFFLNAINSVLESDILRGDSTRYIFELEGEHKENALNAIDSLIKTALDKCPDDKRDLFLSFAIDNIVKADGYEREFIVRIENHI